MINIGCAGAYPEAGLAVGDLALATEEVFGDEGVLAPDGWHPLDLIGIPVVSRNGAFFSNPLQTLTHQVLVCVPSIKLDQIYHRDCALNHVRRTFARLRQPLFQNAFEPA